MDNAKQQQKIDYIWCFLALLLVYSKKEARVTSIARVFSFFLTAYLPK